MIEDAKERLETVRNAIERAARIAHRDPSAIKLIAISKTRPVDDIRALIDAGQRSFGENRVQEAEAKWTQLLAERPDLDVHLVGQLQSNKAQEAVSLFGTIHSLDRPSLVDAIARAQDRTSRRPDCFVQVNIGNETQKGGCSVEQLPQLLDQARTAGLMIVGLMAVPPATLEPAPFFALLAKLARDHDLAQLSMGMSGDFETAIMLGATHVRVGTALFGDRE